MDDKFSNIKIVFLPKKYCFQAMHLLDAGIFWNFNVK